jgi:outer membrane protein OmpU
VLFPTGINLEKIKKIGLTALGTALVTAGSAQAASMSVSASTSLFFNGEDNSDMGNGWSMTDSVTFSGSGEMDNGFTVSTTIELDGAVVDTRTLSIDTGDMGKITFSGDGSSGPIGSWDDITPSANEESWGVATSGTASGAANPAATNDIFVYDYTIMDGLALKASYTPSDGTAAIESSVDYGLLYTGIDGLSLYAAMGENNNQPTTGITGKADLSMFGVTYAMGAITVGYQINETDSGNASQDEDFTALGVSYAVSDDLSVSLNQSEIDFESTTEDQEATGVSFSYTSGGMTISGTHSTIDNQNGTATSDFTGYEVNFIFAF